MQGARRSGRKSARKDSSPHRPIAAGASSNEANVPSQSIPANTGNDALADASHAERSPDPAAHPAETAATGSRGAGEWLGGVGQRLRTAAILIPIVIMLVWFGGWVAFVGALATLALCLWELNSVLEHRGWSPILALSGLFGLDLLVAAMLPAYRIPLVVLGISALVVAPFLWLMLARRDTLDGALIDWALTLGAGFYLGWPMAMFVLVRGSTYGYHSNGFWWMLTLFFTVWSFDTFAFFAGHFWGRTKLAPHISPKKSWEGAAGGLVFALLAAWLFTRPIGVPWYHALAIGALVSIAATVGDLAESMVKRAAGVKDSGTIMPGHGGVLDRIDSLLFAVMVVFFYAAFLHTLPL